MMPQLCLMENICIVMASGLFSLLLTFCSLAFGFWLTECFKFITMLIAKN